MRDKSCLDHGEVDRHRGEEGSFLLTFIVKLRREELTRLCAARIISFVLEVSVEMWKKRNRPRVVRIITHGKVDLLGPIRSISADLVLSRSLEIIRNDRMYRNG